jgi:hypothetical protein
MFTNGSTAMECGGGEKVARVALATTPVDVGGDAGYFEIQWLSMAK